MSSVFGESVASVSSSVSDTGHLLRVLAVASNEVLYTAEHLHTINDYLEKLAEELASPSVSVIVSRVIWIKALGHSQQLRVLCCAADVTGWDIVVERTDTSIAQSMRQSIEGLRATAFDHYVILHPVREDLAVSIQNILSRGKTVAVIGLEEAGTRWFRDIDDHSVTGALEYQELESLRLAFSSMTDSTSSLPPTLPQSMVLWLLDPRIPRDCGNRIDMDAIEKLEFIDTCLSERTRILLRSSIYAVLAMLCVVLEEHDKHITADNLILALRTSFSYPDEHTFIDMDKLCKSANQYGFLREEADQGGHSRFTPELSLFSLLPLDVRRGGYAELLWLLDGGVIQPVSEDSCGLFDVPGLGLPGSIESNVLGC